MSQTYTPGAAPPPESDSGKKIATCFGIGCLTVLVVGVVAVIAVMAWTKKAVGDFADKYTSDDPVKIEMPLLSDQQVADVSTRFDEFKTNIAAGNATVALRLSETDINALITKHPDFSAIAGVAVASIENDQLTVDSSFEIDKLGIPFPGFIADRVSGKYFNGSITVEITTIGGQPAVFIQNIAAGDTPIPQVLIDSLKTENLLQNQNSDPKMQKAMEKIQEIKIENNQIVVTPSAP